MTNRIKFLIAAAFVIALCAAHPAMAAEPPADLCSLLAPADISKSLGGTYNAPEKSVAPRPFPGTDQGTDCHYKAGRGPELFFRAYVDPSPAAATELFHRLGMFYSSQTPVPGLADEAYFDKTGGLHVRKGKVRYFLELDAHSTATVKQQLTDLATRVAGQL